MVCCCIVTRIAAAKKFGSSVLFSSPQRAQYFSDADKNRQASLTLNEESCIFLPQRQFFAELGLTSLAAAHACLHRSLLGRHQTNRSSVPGRDVRVGNKASLALWGSSQQVTQHTPIHTQKNNSWQITARVQQLSDKRNFLRSMFSLGLLLQTNQSFTPRPQMTQYSFHLIWQKSYLHWTKNPRYYMENPALGGSVKGSLTPKFREWNNPETYSGFWLLGLRLNQTPKQ